jgi:hypothetical protein
MNFEERLLAELKAEAAERAARKRVRRSRKAHGRRLLTAAGIAGACTLAAIVAPTVTGSEAAAYAVTRNADGSITVTINEMRDSGKLERDLAANGVRADITYLPQRKRCAGDGRGTSVDPQPPRGVPMKSRKMEEWVEGHGNNMPTSRAFRWPSPRKTPNVFEVFPEYIQQDQMLVLELGESHMTKQWKLGVYLISGPVKPCVLENDPFWN